MITEKTIRCGECGIDTVVPTICAVCFSPLVRGVGVDGESVLSCPHDGDFKGGRPPKGYGPTTRDVVPGFGAAVKTRREALGLSTTKLAKLAGTHQTTVSKIENETRAPSLLLAFKLATALSVTVDALLQDAARFAHS
jgi:DNA-binding XRE family transcriptional regulator